MDVFESVKSVFDSEISALCRIRDSLCADVADLVNSINECRGVVALIGMGKSGHIAQKIVATMQSLGTRAVFLHPSECMHGDLGFLRKGDIALLFSNSGETKEILDIVPHIRSSEVPVYSVVGRAGSTLGRISDCEIVLEQVDEAYLDNLVPTSTTTSTLVLGDAIAVTLARMRGFTKDDFGRNHPNGLIGKKLTLRVADIMVSGANNSVIPSGSTLKEAVLEMCKKPVGAVSIIDEDGTFIGIFTDGDLRRLLNTGVTDMDRILIDDVMVKSPVSIRDDALVYGEISKTINSRPLSLYPVVDSSGKAVGTLRMLDIMKTGLLS